MNLLRTGRRTVNIVVILGFVLALPLPILDMLDDDLAPTPRIDRPVSLKRGAVKRWLKSNFGFRDFFVQTHGRLQFDLFGVSPTDKVLPGRPPWLFLRSGQVLDSSRNLYLFSAKELQAWVDMLAHRHAACTVMSIPYLFLVAPSKSTIYQEQLPQGWEPVRTTSRLDQFYEALTNRIPQLETLDLRPILRLEAQRHRIYHHTDSHWNELGAFAAVQTVHRHLARQFPQLEPVEAPTGIEARRQPYGGDLARLMGLKHVFHEEELRPVLPPRKLFVEGGGPLDLQLLDGPSFGRLVTVCPDAPLASAVVFHDSFGKVMVPYLGRLFRRTIFIWSNQFDEAVVARERPQVVLQEIVERRLLNWQPDSPPRMPP